MRAIRIKFYFLLACPSVLAALSVVSAAETDPQKAKASADDTTVWYDCKDLVVEGKGWIDTKSLNRFTTACRRRPREKCHRRSGH